MLLGAAYLLTSQSHCLQVADVFAKHVAPATLDACMRGLVHATADGSDNTKVSCMCISYRTVNRFVIRCCT